MPNTSAKPKSQAASRESPFTVLFPDFDSEMAATRRMLERVPNGKNDWRPHAKSRTLGELASHIAQLPGLGIAMVTADELDFLAPRPPEPPAVTTADRVKRFDELSAHLRGLLQQMTKEQGARDWTLRSGDRIFAKSPRTTTLRTAFLTHTAHHRAQLGVYLRLLDVAVPWTYGGSADEAPPM
ncbi:MAG TPA: DinB family protein [Gemmatimonadaceae bacterium]|nr:DinB family protein [Gemmatimonadaceae bacterium]